MRYIKYRALYAKVFQGKTHEKSQCDMKYIIYDVHHINVHRILKKGNYKCIWDNKLDLDSSVLAKGTRALKFSKGPRSKCVKRWLYFVPAVYADPHKPLSHNHLSEYKTLFFCVHCVHLYNSISHSFIDTFQKTVKLFPYIHLSSLLTFIKSMIIQSLWHFVTSHFIIYQLISYLIYIYFQGPPILNIQFNILYIIYSIHSEKRGLPQQNICDII